MASASEIMLEAASASPNYDAVIFEHPLAECLFQVILLYLLSYNHS